MKHATTNTTSTPEALVHSRRNAILTAVDTMARVVMMTAEFEPNVPAHEVRTDTAVDPAVLAAQAAVQIAHNGEAA
jgi:hypothetical protein